MNRRIWLLMLLLVVLTFSGCALRTVEDMYCLPKRSEAYNQLQSAIDVAMVGLEYASPESGANRQTVQMADLDGDGSEEYLVFARGTLADPLQLMIFHQEENGEVRLMELISGSGTAFQQVEYAELDDNPGCEIILGRKVSNQVMGNVSLYGFSDGRMRQMLSIGYSKFLTCDLDRDGRGELLVFSAGEAEMDNGVAALYSYRNGIMERSLETELSVPVARIKRIDPGMLRGGKTAVYVSGSTDRSTIVTDVFAYEDGRLINVPVSAGLITGVNTLKNYYVYPEDLTGDGIPELPELIAMKPISPVSGSEQQYLLRWYDLDIDGSRSNRLCTFHNYSDGWYLRLENTWAERLTLEQRGGSYTFYMWNNDFNKVTVLFTIYALDDQNLDRFDDGNQFILKQGEGITYTARLEYGSATYGFTEEYLIESFHLIQRDQMPAVG